MISIPILVGASHNTLTLGCCLVLPMNHRQELGLMLKNLDRSTEAREDCTWRA